VRGFCESKQLHMNIVIKATGTSLINRSIWK